VTGRIAVDGRVPEQVSIRALRRLGVALVPADRSHESVIGDFSVRENVSLAALPTLTRGGKLVLSRERAFAREWLGAVSADTSVAERHITTLSGGNQQKSVLARWLSVHPKVLAVSEPTAGIDIGARTAIYEELRRRADEGLAVVMSSSDAEDLIAVCDRVVVLRDGVLVAELPAAELNKSAIIAAAEGVHGDHS
jgi:ABC-type sugar transport system ATPase subunit